MSEYLSADLGAIIRRAIIDHNQFVRLIRGCNYPVEALTEEFAGGLGGRPLYIEIKLILLEFRIPARANPLQQSTKQRQPLDFFIEAYLQAGQW